MTREEAHILVDQLFDKGDDQKRTPIHVKHEDESTTDKKIINASGQRVVRTKSTADRVYLLDERKGTRQWVTNPQVLEKLGFTMSDVEEITDEAMLKYQQAQALYRVDT